jgi:multidrug efflux system membrane fusion protein
VPQLVSVPLSALAKREDQPIVWTVDRANDTVHSRPVRIADFTADGVRIAEGLKPGDVVVSAGTQFMAEGLKVKHGAGQLSAAADDVGNKAALTR